jgi:hypothetical protein
MGTELPVDQATLHPLTLSSIERRASATNCKFIYKASRRQSTTSTA